MVVMLLLFCLVGFTWSCSIPEHWKHPTLVYQILDSERILYGRSKNIFPDPREQAGSDKTFTVEFEVYCVLKGETTPQLVNISEAGVIHGYCHATEFAIGQDFVAILQSHGGDKLYAHREIEATKENLELVVKACGLNPVTRPEGSTSTVVCPVSVVDCQSSNGPGFHAGLSTIIMTTVVVVVVAVAAAALVAS